MSAESLVHELEYNPDADPRDLGTRQIDALRNHLLADEGGLFAFCWLVFQYKDLKPELHGEICNLLGMWKRDQDSDVGGNSRFLVQIPREFFKTSVCTRANALWQICRGFYSGQDDAVAIVNERLDNPAKWIRAIRDVVSSSRIFQTLFRDLLPPGIAYNDTRNKPQWWKWSDTELLFERSAHGIPEASITGLGITAASTGGHWPTIIKDDIISIEASRSPAVMEYSKDWFDASLYLERPAMKGRDLVVCTPWTFDDTYSYITEKYGYKVYRRSALENGKSIFPEKLTTQELLSYQEKQPFKFAAQMQCRPMPGQEQNFLHSWLKWGNLTADGEKFVIEPAFYDPKLTMIEDDTTPSRTVRLSDMNKVLLFDPAPSEQRDKNKERKARNGIVVEGIDCWGRRYLLDCWADRVDPLDVLEQIYFLCDKWGTNIVAIEEENFSKLYRPMLTMYGKLHKDSKHLRFKKLLTRKQDKDTRITAQIPKARSGIYHVNRVNMEKWIQEYVEYPFSGTRDLMDGWAYDDAVQRPQSAGEIQIYREAQQHGRGKGTADRITGY